MSYQMARGPQEVLVALWSSRWSGSAVPGTRLCLEIIRSNKVGKSSLVEMLLFYACDGA
jgi:hypothetical protein